MVVRTRVAGLIFCEEENHLFRVVTRGFSGERSE